MKQKRLYPLPTPRPDIAHTVKQNFPKNNVHALVEPDDQRRQEKTIRQHTIACRVDLSKFALKTSRTVSQTTAAAAAAHS